ncbi:MAG: Nre family DNA repair protein [Candidatus Thorarchaeota archaeon]
MSQTHLEKTPDTNPSYNERVCSRCQGHRFLCGIRPCPLLMRAKALTKIESSVNDLNLVGASPPSVFVGSQGYPKVLAGPLVPPTIGDEVAIMERPDLWLTRKIDEIISIRFSLVRTKKAIPVTAAADPDRLLLETQTMALSDTPTVSEATLIKRPSFTSVFTGRTLPIGPSAPLEMFKLEDNPKVPKPVDKVTSDTDLTAVTGVMDLFNEGIRQEHLTRLLSIGLLGRGRSRRLVPTQWSITAIDDIIGRRLHRQVQRLPSINDYYVYADQALGNKVVLLFLPTSWKFDALECWIGTANPPVISDHEWYRGRKDYAKLVAGAYYATRLPVLDFLVNFRKQAGVIVFMETDPRKWVPLGVWRFREIAKRALSGIGKKFSTLDEAIQEIGGFLEHPVNKWLEVSEVYKEFTTQTRLTEFFE